MGRIRVLVVDDHRIFAEALAAALAAESDVEVGAAGSAAAAERALERAAVEGRAFDVILIDADLGAESAAGARRTARPAADPLDAARRPPAVVPAPRRPAPAPAGAPPAAVHPAAPQYGAAPAPDGITLLARIRRNHPGLRAVVLATADDPHRAARALHAGATGWVAKESSLARLLSVIRGVLRDETHLPPALLTGVIRELTTARRDRTESERLVDTLTPREKQILRCMVAGLGRQAVAERLYLSPHTVRTHMQNVLGKLGVHSTLAAVAVARRAGISPTEPAAPTAAPSVVTTTAPGAG
ncbi:response regulator transcription factor [Streptomyces sp. CB01881]|uniref:LuxR C-terminal-related transcriptional regulator n=1 Tax=Streptomyces sp. CB01881 TaxID=2078691 RepID=UPI000CDC2D99|nr:response regulator transcription factor [Streptomyces sp. CB01881]AUY50095.1 DNA-binding response regulator [Streptomyces sp. CB01881]TYC73491.1 DNA-binding response regulator [Streptomyces sp. CB01881]